MWNSKILPTAVCLLANFVLAGYIVQTGLLTGPLSESMDISVTEATRQFTMIYGGYMLGTLLVFFGLDYMPIKTALLSYCVLTILACICVVFATNLTMIAMLFGVIGTMGGVSAGLAGTILGRLWQGNTRQTFLVAQDASFNFGGTLYPLATVAIFAAGYNWPYIFVFVSLGLGVVFLLCLFSQFDTDSAEDEQLAEETEWNAGIVGAGLALFVTITAKYLIIIWLPSFAETVLGATNAEAGQLISAIFAMALAGAVVGTVLVSRIRLVYFMVGAVLLGFGSSIQFTFSKDYDYLLVLAGVFGIAIAVLYNVFVAFGVSFVKAVSHKHVAYILLCAGLAQTIAPGFSSLIAEWFDTATVLITGAAFYGAVIVMLIGLELTRRSD